ncbi:hypothetical protein SAMN05443665_1009103 [Actinomadura meyerae]|uniref:Secreted protein n=1 Tax=Actinomadura meyerae TaxID=240840 RepID=A0A239HCD4_9ACTN|nr:DUF6493 family protein [Actinomadura meyerae]SNS79059.1 hypothetical protein SAMN05443665_1009103 [Actinomadura meyerae]
MSTWAELRQAIQEGGLEATARAVTALDDTERRTAAAELPRLLKEMRAATEYGWFDDEVMRRLLIAGAGAIGGPAAAASWLCRTDLRLWWWGDDAMRLLDEVTRARPAEWRAEVARRIGDRMRVFDGERARWEVAAALARSAGAPPPVSDGFVVGWVAGPGHAEDLARDPFLDTLLPKLFEAEGVGAALADDANRVQWDASRETTWAAALVDLARAGRIERRLLLDGCVSRFLRGGTAHSLRWFAGLHDALEPTDEETVDRLRDYVRLLPTAPPVVADLALRQVRRADDLGRLGAEPFTEAADAVLFRPERKLVRACLTWLDRTARRRGRVDATLRALTALFPSEVIDLRERAVKIAAKHAARAGEAVRAEVRDAAGVLPAGPRAAIADAFGEVEALPEPVSPGPLPYVPRAMPAPIGSLAELADEFGTLVRAEEEWAATERFLAALIDHAHRDPGGTREALWKVADDIAPWITRPDDYAYMRRTIEASWVAFPVDTLLFGRRKRAAGLRAALSLRRSRPGAAPSDPPLARFLEWRLRETASSVGTRPLLLATPTEASGHIDPDVLVGRLERLEEAGAEPGRADLAQAMLRVPREVGPAAPVRAKALASGAGRAVASWLAAGGLPDPAVTCEIIDPRSGTGGDRASRPPALIRTSVDVPGDTDADRVCALSARAGRDAAPWNLLERIGHWPAILPSHREVAAAHLAVHAGNFPDDVRMPGAAMLGVAEADGPAGPATAALLAFTLAADDQRDRSNAVDALVTLSARDALPAAETGTALGRLCALGRIPLPRTLKALTAAADAGAHADVWTVLATALPHMLPAPGERAPAGLPSLVALATRMAEVTGAKGAVPAVAEVAARGGSSRLVTECARLHRTIAT